MKVTQRTFEYNDYRSQLVIEVDGIQEIRVGDGEPEDNTLGRNFNDCYNIVSLIEKAHEAGKRGEELEIKYSEEEGE